MSTWCSQSYLLVLQENGHCLFVLDDLPAFPPSRPPFFLTSFSPLITAHFPFPWQPLPKVTALPVGKSEGHKVHPASLANE